MNKVFALTCMAAGLLQALPAAADSTAPAVTEYGAPTFFHGHEVRSFFSHNGSEVLALGVEVPTALYDTAPMDPSDGLYDIPFDADDPAAGVAWHCCGHEIVVAVPESALRMSAFRHIVLNWNPQGHAPPGVYDPPHTDFHFYFMTDKERRAIGRARDAREMCVIDNPLGPEPPKLPIPQTCEQLEITGAALPADQMPPGYQNLAAAEPAMGNHLLDLNSHEFHGQAFDHTFIYMAYAGSLTGMEPMISLQYLRDLTEPAHVPISMPAAFPVAGQYPTEYVMEYDRERALFRVSYAAWRPFPASGGQTARH